MPPVINYTAAENGVTTVPEPIRPPEVITKIPVSTSVSSTYEPATPPFVVPFIVIVSEAGRVPNTVPVVPATFNEPLITSVALAT